MVHFQLDISLQDLKEKHTRFFLNTQAGTTDSNKTRSQSLIEKKFFSVFVIKAARSERSGKITCFQLFESLSLLFPFSQSEKSYEMKTARL